jgi:hypothetical protein
MSLSSKSIFLIYEYFKEYLPHLILATNFSIEIRKKDLSILWPELGYPILVLKNMKFFLLLFTQYAMNGCDEVEVKLNEFLTSTLDGGDWSPSRSGCFTLKERIPVLMENRVDGLQSQSGRVGKKFLALTRVKPPSSSP